MADTTTTTTTTTTSGVKISELPAAGPLLGDELIELAQQGDSRRGRIGDIWAPLQTAIGDVQAAQDSAFQAQAYELGAQDAELSARLSQAQNFPSHFVDDSKYWTGGNGQAGSPTVAANNPLPGLFVDVTGEGHTYQTEFNPQNCNSMAPVGVITGVPGTRIRLRARVRATIDNTGGTPSAVGVALIHLGVPFNYLGFFPGTALPSHTVANGWQEVEYDYTVPAVGAADYAAYYRPSFFYNVVGASTDPIHGSNDPQGNQQFQVAWFETVVTPTVAPAPVPAPNIVDRTSGSGTYTPSALATYAKVRMKGGGGGGGGGGTPGAGNGGNGGNTTFGGWTASGGAGGSGYTGTAPGGAGGGTTAPGGATGFWARTGAFGVSGPGGFQFNPGGAGGSGNPGIPAATSQQSRFADGAGGAGGGAGSAGGPGGGGGEGGEIVFFLSGATLVPTAYSVGGGGTAGAAGTNGAAGTAAFGGFITIEEYFS